MSSFPSHTLSVLLNGRDYSKREDGSSLVLNEVPSLHRSGSRLSTNQIQLPLLRQETEGSEHQCRTDGVSTGSGTAENRRRKTEDITTEVRTRDGSRRQDLNQGLECRSTVLLVLFSPSKKDDRGLLLPTAKRKGFETVHRRGVQ